MKRKTSIFKPWDVMYYYVRNQGHRVGVVALYEVPPERKGQRTMYCRGISICSVHDQFDAVKGKAEALGRCRKAFYSKINQEPINRRFMPRNGGRAMSLLRFAMNYQGYKIDCKSTYGSRISTFEKKIVEGRARAAGESTKTSFSELPFLTGEMKLIKTGPFKGMYERKTTREEGE